MIEKIIKRAPLLPAIAASAVCAATLYALNQTLSYLFRDVEQAKADPKVKDSNAGAQSFNLKNSPSEG